MKEEKIDVKRICLTVVKVGILMAAITVLLLMLLAFILLKAGFSDKVVLICIGGIYFIANLAGGWVMGKTRSSKKLLWGMLTGAVYFMMLLIASFIVNGKLFQGDMPVFAAGLCCILGGMAGGVLNNL